MVPLKVIPVIHCTFVLVQGKVKHVQPRGVSVVLGGHLQGFIPDIHLADVPLKHPEKLYQSGKKIRCKVFLSLHVNFV